MNFSDVVEKLISSNAKYNIADDLYYENEGLTHLLFQSFEALDSKYNFKHLKDIPNIEIYSLTDWKRLKKTLFKKWSQVKKYIELFLDRAYNVENYLPDKNEALDFWNAQDESGYPRDKFESFEDWYESNDYYDWVTDDNQLSWDNFINENKDIYSHLDVDYRYAKNYMRTVNQFESALIEIIKSYDQEIKENKYTAVESIFINK